VGWCESRAREGPGFWASVRIKGMKNRNELSRPAPRGRGIIVPMITPLLDRDTLDVAGLERHIERLLGGGVHGVFALGSTGEAPSLSRRLRCELVERVCGLVDGRVPVLVGVNETSLVEGVQFAEHAAGAGAAALVLSTPGYYLVSQAELTAYYEAIIPQLPLPVFLYNIPSLTKLSIEPETVQRAAELPGVLGLKDTSRDMIYFHKVHRLMADRPDFALLVGPEQLLAEAVMMGAHGGVHTGSNIWPRLYVDLYEAAAARDLDRVNQLQKTVMQLSTSIYGDMRYAANIKGAKCALSLMGICRDTLAEPFQPFDEARRQQVHAALADLGLLGSRRPQSADTPVQRAS